MPKRTKLQILVVAALAALTSCSKPEVSLKNFVGQIDKRPTENWVSVENRTDGFSMSVQESVQGDLSLGATSPCVWPNGTPAPQTT